MNTDIHYGGSQFSIPGMPGVSSYLFTMDGLSINDNGYNGTLSGFLGLILSQNQVQEATIVSTGLKGLPNVETV